MQEKLLTIKEAQERLRIHYNTITKYIRLGYIPVVKYSNSKRFIREQDLENFLQEHTGVYKQ